MQHKLCVFSFTEACMLPAQQTVGRVHIHNYACSVVHSELSWWGLRNSRQLHVAHVQLCSHYSGRPPCQEFNKASHLPCYGGQGLRVTPTLGICFAHSCAQCRRFDFSFCVSQLLCEGMAWGPAGGHSQDHANPTRSKPSQQPRASDNGCTCRSLQVLLHPQ
jgi:hypothetical protein